MEFRVYGVEGLGIVHIPPIHKATYGEICHEVLGVGRLFTICTRDYLYHGATNGLIASPCIWASTHSRPYRQFSGLSGHLRAF